MKNIRLATFALFLVLFSCRQEDPGPRQHDEKSFALVDFDRLEVSDAFDLTVEQGSVFSINARGDHRDISDMVVDKQGATLVLRYKTNGYRQYVTQVTITMPVLYGADFSGGVNSKITAFSGSIGRFDLSSSGSSTVQLELYSQELYLWLSGASNLRVTGTGKKIEASVSGASELTSLDYPVEEVKITVSGASRAKVSALESLNVSASGGSDVRYRGNPQIEQSVTGASSVGPE